MNAKTPAQRKADERQRRTESGQARLELWAHPDDHEAIKAYAEKLAKRRARQMLVNRGV